MSKPISFIFVRHGQSQANANGIVNDSGAPLTELGATQAKQTAMALRDFGITAIVHSPMQRALETAEIIAAELDIGSVDVTVLDELRERGLGLLEGRPMDRKPVLYYSDEDDALGFEPPTILYKRMLACLSTLSRAAAKQNILVVGHSISGFYLLQAAAKKTSPESFGTPSDMSNASFIKVTIQR